MIRQSEVIQKGDGLCLVDVQIDFCPGGLWSLRRGGQIIPILNQWTRAALEKGNPI